MKTVEDAASKLGIGVFELFARARAGYGGARDSSRNSYNKYLAFGEVPYFVTSFIAAQGGSHEEVTYYSGPRPALLHGGSPQRFVR